MRAVGIVTPTLMRPMLAASVVACAPFTAIAVTVVAPPDQTFARIDARTIAEPRTSALTTETDTWKALMPSV